MLGDHRRASPRGMRASIGGADAAARCVSGRSGLGHGPNAYRAFNGQRRRPVAEYLSLRSLEAVTATWGVDEVQLPRYSGELNKAVPDKMLPPHNRPLSELAAKEGISEATLDNGRGKARTAGTAAGGRRCRSRGLMRSRSRLGARPASSQLLGARACRGGRPAQAHPHPGARASAQGGDPGRDRRAAGAVKQSRGALGGGRGRRISTRDRRQAIALIAEAVLAVCHAPEPLPSCRRARSSRAWPTSAIYLASQSTFHRLLHATGEQRRLRLDVDAHRCGHAQRPRAAHAGTADRRRMGMPCRKALRCAQRQGPTLMVTHDLGARSRPVRSPDDRREAP
jgi:hypothetical protein